MIQVQWHEFVAACLLLGGFFWPTAGPQAGSMSDGHLHPTPIVEKVPHQGKYDGRWIANVPPQGACPASQMTLEVRGSAIRGTVVNPFGAFPIVGALMSGGTGTIQIVQMGGRITFTGNRFIADYFNTCGPRRAVGRRLTRPGSGVRI